MIVTLKQILQPAEEQKYAVISPVFLSTGMLRHYLAVAEKYRAPVIAAYPPLAVDALGSFKRRVARWRRLCRAAEVPVCLHLDHGRDVPACLKAIACGFTSVMIDASSRSMETNVKMTRQVVTTAREAGVSVEAEIGHVGSGKYSAGGKTTNRLTDPDRAAEFVRQTGVDALAISIGTRHGVYDGPARIDFERLAQIRSAVKIPLVLHGGSGTGADNLRQAVAGGIRKINVFTDLIGPYLKSTLAGLNPLQPGGAGVHRRKAVDAILKKYFDISGSCSAMAAGNW